MDFSLALENLNWSAVVVAAVVSILWGMLWYSPAVAGNEWMKASGLKKKDLESTNMTMMAVMVVMAFVSATVLGLVLIGVKGVVDGMFDAAFIGSGIAVTTLVTMYGFGKRRKKLLVIDALFVVTSYAMMGLVFGLLAS